MRNNSSLHNKIMELEAERENQLGAIKAAQENNFNNRVEAFVQQRKNQCNAPQLAPNGMKTPPILDKAAEDRIRLEAQSKIRSADSQYLEQQRNEFNTKISSILNNEQGHNRFESLKCEHSQSITDKLPEIQHDHEINR